MNRITEADVLPFLGRKARIEDGLVITQVGTAWPLNEYLVRRRYETKPQVRARRNEQHRRWVEANREHYNAYQREYRRQWRARQRQTERAA